MPTTTMDDRPPARTAICNGMLIKKLISGSFEEKHIQNYHTKITCKASLAERLAALATRTFARTETHIPTYPAIPEHKAPSRKAATVINAVVDLKIANYESWLANRCDGILENT